MLILITGGAGSGKSEHAERLVCAAAPDTRLYLATMESSGAAAQARIARHRALRQGKGFVTVERAVNLCGLSLPTHYQGVLLEDLGNLTANELFSSAGTGRSSIGTNADVTTAETDTNTTATEASTNATEAVCAAILSGIRHLRTQCDTLVIVTNEVFSDGLHYDPATIRYIQTLGRLNRALCACANVVYESVCGILIPHESNPKGGVS